MRTKLCAACGILLSFALTQSVEAGILWTTHGIEAGVLSIVGTDVPRVEFDNTTPDVFQVDSAKPRGSDGEVIYLGGMFSTVLPDMAYIGIANGSMLSFDAPSYDRLGAGLTFYGSLHVNYSQSQFYKDSWPYYSGGSASELWLIMQYTLNGYLAPGTVLRVSGTGVVDRYGYQDTTLHDDYILTEPGSFSETVFLRSPVQHGIYNDSFDLIFDFRMLFTIDPALPYDWPDVERSWVVLDPGVGAFSDPDAPLPWAPASSSVTPEPASLALWGFGALGLVVGGAFRRFRGKKSESLAA